MMDHKVKEEMDQYFHSLNAVTTTKDPKVNKKEISTDPLIHQIYSDLT
jgi:hypothetical protein